jgi:hypothetical protein
MVAPALAGPHWTASGEFYNLFGEPTAKALRPHLERLDATPGRGSPEERRAAAVEAQRTAAEESDPADEPGPKGGPGQDRSPG